MLPSCIPNASTQRSNRTTGKLLQGFDSKSRLLYMLYNICAVLCQPHREGMRTGSAFVGGSSRIAQKQTCAPFPVWWWPADELSENASSLSHEQQ